MRLPLTINGVDFSELANKYEYEVGYITRTGSNGGVMLDGTRVVDIIAYKASITWPLNDLRDTDLAAIQTACQTPEVTVTFWDTLANAQRTSVFIPVFSTQKIGILRSTGKWWKGISLNLEEK